MKKIILYADGACKGNPGLGGWGCILMYKTHQKELYNAEPHTTNNRMELEGIIKGLEDLKEPCHVDIYTDSQYVQKGYMEWLPGWIQRKWKTASKQPVKNKDLWERLEQFRHYHQLHFHWVKGHNGDFYNERADALANQAIIEFKHKKST